MHLWGWLWPSGLCRGALRAARVHVAVETGLSLGLSVSQRLQQMLEGMGKARPSSLLLFPGRCPAVLCHQGLGLHPSLVLSNAVSPLLALGSFCFISHLFLLFPRPSPLPCASLQGPIFRTSEAPHGQCPEPDTRPATGSGHPRVQTPCCLGLGDRY